MSSSERPPAARARKLSVVSFDGHNSTTVDLDVKYGRRLGAAPSAGRLVSAGSGISTTSTWSFVNKPAASMQVLRNRILITLDKTLSLISEFEQRYLFNADDDFHGIYQEFVKQLLTRIGYKNDLINCEHLETVIIRKFKSEPQIARRADFKSLVVVCARHRAFKEMNSQVQSRLDEVHTYADTFCVTFGSENEGLSFEAVENYENIKTDCLRELRTHLEAAHVSCDELRDIQPMVVYLESYSRVLHHIENVVTSLHMATSNLKKWVIADEQYEKSLDKEIMYLKQKCSRAANDRVTISSLRFEVKARTPNASGKLRKVELTLTKSQNAIEKLCDQQKTLNKSLTDIQESQRVARRELGNIQRKSGRRQNPQSYAGLAPTCDKLREKIEQLQNKEDLIVSKISEVKMKIVAATKDTHMLEVEKTKRKKSCDKTQEQVCEQTTALRSQRKAASTLSYKISVLQKIKSLKQSPETIRKIEFKLINIDYKEAMQTAIWEISNKVGTNWPTIYMKLPFMPPRTNEKKTEDIKSIMRAGAHMEKDAAEMGTMAFERWAKRSTIATINELTYAAKPFIEATTKRENHKKVRYSVPRTKKRFQQLRAKPNVIYV